ncbi:MAG: NYN domain-containing protein [Lachnospiraceae bacterium]|nr:NYN domain-containing protein [Lachnospiraceae bacterium]
MSDSKGIRGLWLIDGSYIYKSAKKVQRDKTEYKNKWIDYKKLKENICREFGIDRLDGWYFNSTPNPATDSQNAFHTWLKSAEPKGPGIRVKLYDIKEKNVRCTECNTSFKIKVQKGVDVGIAVCAMRYFSRYDVIVLSAGDGDFEDFIRYIVEEKDKQLYIAGFDSNISSDLQQFSSANYLLDEHYDEVSNDRVIKPFDGVDDLE